MEGVKSVSGDVFRKMVYYGKSKIDNIYSIRNITINESNNKRSAKNTILKNFFDGYPLLMIVAHITVFSDQALGQFLGNSGG